MNRSRETNRKEAINQNRCTITIHQTKNLSMNALRCFPVQRRNIGRGVFSWNRRKVLGLPSSSNEVFFAIILDFIVIIFSKMKKGMVNNIYLKIFDKMDETWTRFINSNNSHLAVNFVYWFSIYAILCGFK